MAEKNCVIKYSRVQYTYSKVKQLIVEYISVENRVE